MILVMHNRIKTHKYLKIEIPLFVSNDRFEIPHFVRNVPYEISYFVGNVPYEKGDFSLRSK